MIDDTVHFEQTTFLQKIACGWNFSDARAWLDSGCGSELDATNAQSRLSNFVRAVIDLVSDERLKQPWPSTLIYDVDRLMALKVDLHVALYRRACCQACEATIRAFGMTTSVSPEVYERLWTRIAAILEIEVSGQTLSINTRATTLEIVREACRVCKVVTLPEEGLVHFTEFQVDICLDLRYRESQELRDDIRKRLTEIVETEILHLMDMTPIQMLNYVSQRSRSHDTNEGTKGLLSIARRLAHISILHWRVWAPILYEQPQDLMSTAANLSASMNALSLTGLTSDGDLVGTAEKESWSGNASSGETLEMQSSASTSSIDPPEATASEQDSKENKEPIDDPQ